MTSKLRAVLAIALVVGLGVSGLALADEAASGAASSSAETASTAEQSTTAERTQAEPPGDPSGVLGGLETINEGIKDTASEINPGLGEIYEGLNDLGELIGSEIYDATHPDTDGTGN